jgi:hypothetical protein
MEEIHTADSVRFLLYICIRVCVCVCVCLYVCFNVYVQCIKVLLSIILLFNENERGTSYIFSKISNFFCCHLCFNVHVQCIKKFC